MQLRHPMKMLLFLFSSALLLCLAPKLAVAGCPSSGSGGCNLSSNAIATLSPDPNCIEISFDENDCVCQNTMFVENNCSETMQAVNFELCVTGTCFADLEPGNTATYQLPSGDDLALGEQTQSLLIKIGEDQNVELDLSFEVVHVEDGGCSVGGGSNVPGIGTLLLLLALIPLRPRRLQQLENRP